MLFASYFSLSLFFLLSSSGQSNITLLLYLLTLSGLDREKGRRRRQADTNRQTDRQKKGEEREIGRNDVSSSSSPSSTYSVYTRAAGATTIAIASVLKGKREGIREDEEEGKEGGEEEMRGKLGQQQQSISL